MPKVCRLFTKRPGAGVFVPSSVTVTGAPVRSPTPQDVMTTLDSSRQEEATTSPFTPPRPAARPRRQPRWIAAGLLSVCVGGLGAALLYGEATGSHEVLQVVRPISRGEVIRPGDLRPVQVGSLPGISTVPTDRVAELVGRRALIDLAGGSMLPDGAIGQPPVEKGFTQVGLKLAPGRVPVGELPAGTSVLLVPVDDARVAPGQPSAQSSAAPIVSAVVVAAPRIGPDGIATLLDVRVAQDRARQVAELVAADRIVLVREG